MKKKQIIDFMIEALLLGIGILLVIVPKFEETSLRTVMLFSFGAYGFLNLMQYLLTSEAKDYEGLYTALISAAICGVIGLLHLEKVEQAVMVLDGWITLMAITKLIKGNYYNDKNDRMWKLRIFTLVLFVITGILVSISMLHGETPVIMLGYFFLIHGILELIDPMCKYLISK